MRGRQPNTFPASSMISSLLVACLAVVPAGAPPLAVDVTFTKGVSAAPFTGRVFPLASKHPINDAPPRLDWFKPYPLFAQDVKEWRPGEPLRFRPTHGFPHPLAQLPPDTYYVQAVLDFDRGGQNALSAPGNAYSKAVSLDLKKPPAAPVALAVSHVIPKRRFEETERVRLVDVESELLTKFHGKPTRLRAGVVLPASFAKEP